MLVNRIFWEDAFCFHMSMGSNILISILFEKKANFMSHICKNHFAIAWWYLHFVPPSIFISPKWFTFYLNKKLYLISCSVTLRLSALCWKILGIFLSLSILIYGKCWRKIFYFLLYFVHVTWTHGFVELFWWKARFVFGGSNERGI